MARPKNMTKVKAIEKLEEVKKIIQDMLNSEDLISILTSKIYVVAPQFWERLKQLEVEFEPFNDGTKKNSVYSIYKIVNVINADKVAAKYSTSIVKKSSIIKDQGKINELLEKEKEISKNYIMKLARERIENEDLDEFMQDKIIKEANDEIEAEEENFQELKLNADKYELQFTSPPIKYGQVNWVYRDTEGKQVRTNKHISKELPNILILDETITFDKYISSNKTDRFLKNAKKMVGRIYAKYIE